MKKLLLIVIFIFTSLHLYAQTDGISYQAVIIDPNGVELPGVDSNGNILPNAKISIRFTILDASNTEEYQEVQTTETDLFGRINLIIGNQNPDTFTLINWDGTPKDLKVEIDFKGTGSNFVAMSREQLTFVPFSYHRNILARGTLIVDDTTDLNGELKVQGPTNLNSTLNVNNNNDTNLSGQLNVEGATNLKSNFEVAGATTFNDSIIVNAKSSFAGNMQVTADAVFEGKMEFKSDEPASFNAMVVNDSIDVEGPSNLNGQVTVTANNNLADQNDFNHYALKVSGSEQGIAIRVNGSRAIENNYISFWDQTLDDKGTVSAEGGRMWGRIEGITLDEQKDDSEHKWEHAFKIVDIGVAASDLTVALLQVGQGGLDLAAATTSSTVCAGVGACITAPIPSFIASSLVNFILTWGTSAIEAVNLASAITNEILFLKFRKDNIGVSYQSGAGDYAEWLPKEKPSEIFSEGEIVGIKNGQVTKNTWDVEKIMIVSTRPIVLGNMPQPGNEINSVKIAFMGQVPVKVLGKVSPGYYILPNELGGGFAKAVNPKDMKTSDYNKVAGVVWNIIDKIAENLSIVNVAVGINTNDLNTVVIKQEEELKALRSVYNQLHEQLEESNRILRVLVPGYAEATEISADTSEVGFKKQEQNQKHIVDQIMYSSEGDIIYYEISKEQIETSIDMARDLYQDMLNDSNNLNKLVLNVKDDIKYKGLENITLIPFDEHPFWQKIDSDPAYKESIIEYIQSNTDRAFHTHKKYENKFTNLKVR